MLVNLKKQLEKHNNIKLSNKEFAQVLNKLNKGNVFERAKILWDKILYTKDNSGRGNFHIFPSHKLASAFSANLFCFNFCGTCSAYTNTTATIV